MPTHWTYANLEESADLEQGDILQPTDALKHVFRAVHPHFSHDKYLGFVVATQSCDLVLRQSLPKASYINLAAIRPVSQVIQKIFAEVAEPAGFGIFPLSAKPEARRFLERLLNQNEQAIGLFFLHDDADAGIAEPAVAFLRVTVTLRAEHYEILRAARVGRLSAEFRAKLGWLIGNLYARPATPDWGDKEGGKKAFQALIGRYVSEAQWIDDDILSRAKLEGIDVATSLPETLETLRPPSLLDRALREIEAELHQVAPDLPTEKVTKVQNRLRNSGKFTKLFR